MDGKRFLTGIWALVEISVMLAVAFVGLLLFPVWATICWVTRRPMFKDDPKPASYYNPTRWNNDSQ